LEAHRVTAHVGHGEGGPPTPGPLHLAGVGDEFGDVTRSPRRDPVGQRLPPGVAEGGDELQHRGAHAGTEVEHLHARCASKMVQGHPMTIGHIDDVDVVPDTGAVDRAVVVAEDPQLHAAADGDLGGRTLFGSSPSSPPGCAPTGLK